MEFLQDALTPTPAVVAVLVAVVLWHVLKTEKIVKEMSAKPARDEVCEEDRDGL